MVAQTTHTHTNNDSTYTNNDIAIKRIAIARVILELYRYTSSSNNNYANVNIPPPFIEELAIEDEVTAEIVTVADGRKGILLLKKEGQGTIGI